MSAGPPSQPSAPEQGPGGAPALPSPPKKPALDLRATPSGVRPEAWKNLPPPQIIREPPPKPRQGWEGLRARIGAFARTRAGKQTAVALGALLVAAVGVYLFWPKSTLNSHFGALNLFCRALEQRDVAAMRATTAGLASDRCADILALIALMESEHRASRFASASHGAGGAPPGTRMVAATITCRGENGDAFLMIDTNVERQSDGTWRIVAMDTRPLR